MGFRISMRYHGWIFVIVLVISLLGAPEVLAHSPLIARDNISLQTAVHVDNPTKYWVAYGNLPTGNSGAYFYFHMEKNQRIYAQVIVPVKDTREGFVPDFVLMGPGLPQRGVPPVYIEMPQGAGTVMVTGETPPDATYEGFTPSNFYIIGEVDMVAPETGDFYLAVYEENASESSGGHYGVVVGYREEFTIQEWILIPFNVLRIYQWEGQSIFFIILPFVAPLIIGLILAGWLRRQWRTKNSAVRSLGIIIGTLFIGSGCSIFIQMIISLTNTSVSPQIGITLLFTLLPFLLGIFTLRWAIRNLEEFRLKQRAIFILAGILGFFLWAGVIIGPLLALVTSIFPWGKTGSSSQ